jgi:hypothetical protein
MNNAIASGTEATTLAPLIETLPSLTAIVALAPFTIFSIWPSFVFSYKQQQRRGTAKYPEVFLFSGFSTINCSAGNASKAALVGAKLQRVLRSKVHRLIQQPLQQLLKLCDRLNLLRLPQYFLRYIINHT